MIMPTSNSLMCASFAVLVLCGSICGHVHIPMMSVNLYSLSYENWTQNVCFDYSLIGAPDRNVLWRRSHVRLALGSIVLPPQCRSKGVIYRMQRTGL